MAKSRRRWLAGPGGKLSAVVGACGLLLVAGGVALALFAGTSSRVSYVCNGDASGACNCYRHGEEPAGFQMNGSSTGPAAGVKAAILATFGVGAAAAAVSLAHHRFLRVSRPGLQAEGLFLLTPTMGVTLAIAALVLWVSKVEPLPCEDQGALGVLVSVWPSACRW